MSELTQQMEFWGNVSVIYATVAVIFAVLALITGIWAIIQIYKSHRKE